MGLSFFETMSGELVDAEGRVRHVHIDLRCASRRARSLVGGSFHLDGTVSALPWATTWSQWHRPFGKIIFC